MPYVGNPLADAYSARQKQDLTGQSGTSFTLTHSVSSPNDLSVYINHVRQEPTTAYTVNGTALETTGTVAVSDDFYIIYDELAIQSISHPTNQALTATAGTFTSGLVGTTATFSGAVSGTTGTFSGALSAKGGAVFNEDSADVDFRIESDNDANAFFVQGSDGKIGMGISTPRNNLDFGVTSNNDHIIALRDNNTSRTILGLTNGYGVRVASPHDGTNTENMFEVGEIAGDGTTYQNTHFAVTYGGNATIANGNLVIGTAGKGIDFSITGNTSATGASTVNELLDDYEEGTWTPTISSSGGSGVVTTHNGGAKYTKVGREVRVTFQCVLNTKGSGTGYVTILGLPYVTGSASTHYGFAFGYFSGTNNEQRGGWASASTSFMRFNRGANMDAQVQLSELTNGYYLSGSFFYYTDS